MEIKKDILWRVYLSFIGIVLLSLVVLGRAVYIQRFEGPHWRALADSLHQKYVELDAERGTIYSEDGQMLSTSIPYFDVYIDFGAEGLREKNGKRFKANLDSFAIACTNFFRDSTGTPEKTINEYKKELKGAYNQGNRYYLLRKNLSFDQYKTFRTFPLVRLGRNKSGVIVKTNTRRLNPFGLLARRTIGLSRANAQNVGLERTYDSLLKGSTGKQLMRFIAGGAYVPVEGYEIDPENGKDVITTIDVNIQDIAENALMRTLTESGAQHGTCIVMETKTGKIKAIANLGRRPDGRYDEDLNYALHTTEPGSTIKLATLLSVLESGSSRPNDRVDVGTSGSQFVGVRVINDAERQPAPVLTVTEAFAHSSNVGMAKLALKAFGDNPDKFKNYLHRFRLDKKAGIGLVGEEAPLLPKWRKNKEGLHAMLTMSFGYAIEVSPLQTLMLYNAVANGGKLMRPYLVSAIRQNGADVKTIEPEVLDPQIVKPEVIAAARNAMEQVCTIGTAKDVFKDSPFPVGGKTGTAHVAEGPRGYGEGVYQASFAGYFPADAPEYTCIVVVKTQAHAVKHFGGQLAAPVFKEVAGKLYAMNVQGRRGTKMLLPADSARYNYAGYAPGMKEVLAAVGLRVRDSAKLDDWARLDASYNGMTAKPVTVAQRQIPDVRNMTMRDALYVLENLNVKVAARGRGKVVLQDLAPGTPITRNQTINLLLN
ncbi:PASTA domain-containing protein [Flaviaesturariibacter flavus]|uniref:PASTA domain-containing protein n=1 Tax=Flaviaesturariibacter flavus TaxID=2502780 RepID=A0A4R1BBW3_9BACT|nr:penicillin-binding protein [Flaviaesturariibacter flavus]TCJ14515.1 PASTA domain-containing protein [Flaviaesturariibacter flavus]